MKRVLKGVTTAPFNRCVTAALAAVLLAASGCGPRVSGTYRGADGMGSLEFKDGKVYVTSVLGTTFVAPYEVDGDRVIVKGAGGGQVFTLSGDTLDAGMGMKFVKEK